VLVLGPNLSRATAFFFPFSRDDAAFASDLTEPARLAKCFIQTFEP
jgi:hypothetical protein